MRETGSVEPERRFHRFEKRGVRGEFSLAWPMRAGGAELALTLGLAWSDRSAIVAALSRQAQPDLASAGQLDINLCEQFGIEQRAVAGAVAAIDPIAGAQRIEA